MTCVGLSSGSAAITSTRTEDISMAVNQNMTAGMRNCTYHLHLCVVYHSARNLSTSEKKLPSYRLTSEEHFEYITPQKEPKKSTKMSCSKQKNKVQLMKEEICKKTAPKKGFIYW